MFLVVGHKLVQLQPSFILVVLVVTYKCGFVDINCASVLLLLFIVRLVCAEGKVGCWAMLSVSVAPITPVSLGMVRVQTIGAQPTS